MCFLLKHNIGDCVHSQKKGYQNSAPGLLLLQIAHSWEVQACKNVYRQEEEPEAAAEAGEDELLHANTI